MMGKVVRTSSLVPAHASPYSRQVGHHDPHYHLDHNVQAIPGQIREKIDTSSEVTSEITNKDAVQVDQSLEVFNRCPKSCAAKKIDFVVGG